MSTAKPGPYYVVQIPSLEPVTSDVHKPTVLAGGCAYNFCAVVTDRDPGATARLASGERGLVEAVMVPIAPFRDGVPSPWPPLDYLGNITEAVPVVNTQRIRNRL